MTNSWLREFRVSSLKPQASSLFLLLSLIPIALSSSADDPAPYYVNVSGWSYGRERKTLNSSNRVTANFTMKNVSKDTLKAVVVTLTYMSGLGEKATGPMKQIVGVLKPDESRKIAIVGDFIPVFGSYEILVEYDGKRELWFASSDIGQPEAKNSVPIHGIANVVVLGKEAGVDMMGRFTGSVRVKNEGTVEARNVKISTLFYDAKKKKIAECSGRLGTGLLAGGAEENIAFSLPNAPRIHGSYELKVSCDEASPEAALAGGEFTSITDVEFARFTFNHSDPNASGFNVTAQVRNGFSIPVEQVKLSLIFCGPKKKELKCFVHEVPESLKAGEIRTVEFTIPEIPPYESFEQRVAYKKIDGNADGQAPSVRSENADLIETIELIEPGAPEAANPTKKITAHD